MNNLDYAQNLADLIIPGLPKLAGGCLVGHNVERQLWAAALNRAQRRTGSPCRIAYSQGRVGRRDANGHFRPFDGPMIYSAWCACGQFRYDGDEDGRRAAVKAHKTWVALDVNDVVTLHRSRPELDGSEWVVVAVYGEQLTLEDVTWGDQQLRVDRAQVDSVGRRWAEKTCACPRHCRRSSDGRCMAYGCPAPRE